MNAAISPPNGRGYEIKAVGLLAIGCGLVGLDRFIISPLFPVMAKDLGLALDAAKSVGAPLFTGAAAHAVYTQMLVQGHGGKDFSAVYAFLNGAIADGSKPK